MSQNLKHSREGLIEAFEHHLVYEVNMFRATYGCLSMPVEAFGRVVLNALIESFCVHGRNLIEFFDERSETPGQADSNYVGARHFATGYVPWAQGGPSNDLRSRLNKQVSHLTYGRTAKDKEKIGAEQRAELFRLLERELKQFRACLSDQYARQWPFVDSDEVVDSLGVPSATNEIEMVTKQVTSTPPSGSSAPESTFLKRDKSK